MADQEQPKRGPGRPGTYTSAAERARAWRERQKALIAQAKQPAEPVIVEKVVERIVEKVVERIVEKVVEIPVDRNISPSAGKGTAKTRGKAASDTPDAGRLIPLLKPKFGVYGGEEKAKRLRTNAARAASTARDILGMFASFEPIPEAEKDFLEQAARFFEGLNAGFEVAQRGAKKAKAQADAEWKAKREARIADTIRLTFGESPELDEVRTTAETLQRFASRETCAAEARHRGVDRAYFFIHREYELRAALKSNDPQKIAREVAEIRLEVGERGRTWKDRDETCYSAGWSDFLEYRSNENR